MPLPSSNDAALLQALQTAPGDAAMGGAEAEAPAEDPVAIITQIQTLLDQLAQALGGGQEAVPPEA